MLAWLPPFMAMLGPALATSAADAASNVPSVHDSYTTSVTPHEQYSSSVGVLGCKINTNRVAYFPHEPVCERLCVRVTHLESGRSIVLLHVDRSAGAYDVSYDAWNILNSGVSAMVAPQAGGGIQARVEPLGFDDEECLALLSDGTLPVMAWSPQWGLGCPSRDQVKFWNIGDQRCSMGTMEECEINDNFPTCPSGPMGSQVQLGGYLVKDVPYPVKP